MTKRNQFDLDGEGRDIESLMRRMEPPKVPDGLAERIAANVTRLPRSEPKHEVTAAIPPRYSRNWPRYAAVLAPVFVMLAGLGIYASSLVEEEEVAAPLIARDTTFEPEIVQLVAEPSEPEDPVQPRDEVDAVETTAPARLASQSAVPESNPAPPAARVDEESDLAMNKDTPPVDGVPEDAEATIAPEAGAQKFAQDSTPTKHDTPTVAIEGEDNAAGLATTPHGAPAPRGYGFTDVDSGGLGPAAPGGTHKTPPSSHSPRHQPGHPPPRNSGSLLK